MSDTEQEIAEAMGEDDEQTGADVTGPTVFPHETGAPLEAPEEDEQETEEDTEPEDYEPGVHEQRLYDERELEKIGKKLDLDKAAHRRKLEGILGDDLGGHIPCPVCMDGIDGFIVPPDVAPLSDEQVSRMKQLLGLQQWENMSTAPWANTCATCNGYGSVKTGSYVNGRETVECADCGGAGYINTHRGAAVVQIAPDNGPVVTGPTVIAEPDPDPRVEALRRDGFIVIPQPQVQTG